VDEAIVPDAPNKIEARPPYDISKIDFDRLRKEFERSQARRTTVQNLKQAVEERLSKLIAQNPLRTDLQRHYEEIVADYNREKDRVTIENTFAALLKFVQELDDEESRAMRIKKVATELLAALKAEKLRIENWREKEATRDAVQVTIENFLWADNTGLPAPAYSEEDVKTKSRDVYRHIHRVYPTLPSPFYTS
jgi:type I restriction enzyme R subunit